MKNIFRKIKFTRIPALLVAVLFYANAMAQCTQFIGYSQTNNWYGEFETAMGSAQNQYQLLWNSGGAMAVWQDPAYTGWSNAPLSPCSAGSSAPTRVVLDITHNQYLTPANVGPDPIAFMDTVIRNVIATAMTKYPSMTEIVLKPVVGAPNHSDSCYSSYPDPSYNEVPEVRASYNHPIIYSAILLVVANPPAGITVTLGPDTHVGDCSQYINKSGDYHGHLTQAGQDYVAPVVTNFFLGSTTAMWSESNLIANISVYPNPFSSSATLHTDVLNNATITICNSLGQVVREIKNVSGQTNTLCRGNLANGIYFFRLTEKNKNSAVRKLVITNN